MSLALRLYNTLTRRVEPVVPHEEGKVSVYCCGPTTYDISHAGHGRTFITPDLLVRHLRASGVTVRYVRNITDVDDKILKRARERGEEPTELSARFATMFQEDMAQLSCRTPDVEPRVSQTIPRIIDLVKRLIASESAYAAPGEAGGEDVWFAVRKFPTYGKLSGRSLDELRSGEGLEDRGKTTHEGKRDPLDFALWKSAPPGEWAFDSPWGRGRPGWHIECSAMVEEHLGFGIDIHAGGMDLIFPHHENEIAQSEAACPGHGPFATMWMHGGFLNVDKEKMAKSLGNFVTMRDCFARNDPEALRTFLLGAHYRGPVEFETHKLDDGRVVFPLIDEAEARVDYFYATVDRLSALAGAAASADAPKDLVELAKTIRGARARVAAALDDDLNGPQAMAVVNDLAKAANDLCDLAQKRKKDAAFVAAAASLATEAKAAFLSCTDVLGIVQSEPAEYAARTRARRLSVLGLDAAAIEEKVHARRAARDAKDFARGDAIRDELAALGVEIADSPTGTTWRVGIKRAKLAAGRERPHPRPLSPSGRGGTQRSFAVGTFAPVSPRSAAGTCRSAPLSPWGRGAGGEGYPVIRGRPRDAGLARRRGARRTSRGASRPRS
jgi:cysteinyl-tRNA synthetase